MEPNDAENAQDQSDEASQAVQNSHEHAAIDFVTLAMFIIGMASPFKHELVLFSQEIVKTNARVWP